MQGINEFLKNTMMIERFFGVTLYFTIVMIIYCLLRNTSKPKKIKSILIFSLLILTIMGAMYIPEETADLYRIWQTCDYFATKSFNVFFKSYCVNNPTPVSNLLFYLIGTLGIKCLLPAFASFMFHFSIFYIIKLINEKGDIIRVNLALCFLFVMSLGRFMMAISGIRSLPGLAVLAFCFSKEIINKKINPLLIIIELLVALMHPICLVVIIIRVLIMFITSYGKLISRVFNYLVCIILIFLIIRYGGFYIENAFNKAEQYLENTIYNNFWERVISTCLFLMMIFVCIKSIIINSKIKNNKITNFIILNAVYLLIELIFIYEFNIFHRLSSFSAVMILPLLALVLKNDKNNKLRRVIFVYSFLILILSCIRGDLSGYKFFKLW